MALADLKKTYGFRELVGRARIPKPCYVGSFLIPKSSKILLGGEAKIGKSFTSMELCRALATGTLAFGSVKFSVAEPVKVLLCDKELGPDTMGIRLENFFQGASEETLALADKNIHVVSGHPLFKFDAPHYHRAIKDKLDEVRPNVMIVDPVSKFMDGSDQENDHVKRFLEFMDVLIELHQSEQLSIIMSHHFRKPQTDFRGQKIDPGSSYNFRGGSKWYDDMDTLVTIQRHDVNKAHWRLECSPECRHGASPETFWLDVKPEGLVPVLETTSPQAALGPLKKKLLG